MPDDMSAIAGSVTPPSRLLGNDPQPGRIEIGPQWDEHGGPPRSATSKQISGGLGSATGQVTQALVLRD